METINDIKRKISEARLKYRPTKIKTIIVAEAPPDSIERFFYFENVKVADFLFLGIIEVLYPKLKDQYMNWNQRRSPIIKRQILNRFMSDGYFLLDLSEIPKGLLKKPINSCLDDLITRIPSKKINVILIKANVYDCCYKKLLNDGYSVINKRIPFPSTGQQIIFKKLFNEAIELQNENHTRLY
ncbi:MAG: hypothetical protein ACHQHN_05135 [Sphingobacteriales bacterium]